MKRNEKYGSPWVTQMKYDLILFIFRPPEELSGGH